MTPVKHRYSNWTFRSLLIAAYLLLFVSQLNGRFYLIANFYVYGSGISAMAAHATSTRVRSEHTPMMCRETRAQKPHLSLDKRYHGQSFLYTFSHSLIGPLCCLNGRSLYGFFSDQPVLQDRSAALLRGPPCTGYSI